MSRRPIPIPKMAGPPNNGIVRRKTDQPQQQALARKRAIQPATIRPTRVPIATRVVWPLMRCRRGKNGAWPSLRCTGERFILSGNSGKEAPKRDLRLIASEIVSGRYAMFEIGDPVRVDRENTRSRPRSSELYQVAPVRSTAANGPVLAFSTVWPFAMTRKSA